MLQSIVIMEYWTVEQVKGYLCIKFISLNLKKIYQVLCGYIIRPIYKQFVYT